MQRTIPLIPRLLFGASCFCIPAILILSRSRARPGRHSGMDAGIQSQGCEARVWHSAGIKPRRAFELPSLALDSGVHAGMTGFEAKLRIAVCIPTAWARLSEILENHSLEELVNTGMSTPPRNITVTPASEPARNSGDSTGALRVVTAEVLSAFGYRTLAEALRSLPGVYVTHDRNYTYVGVRGFGRPWDYNSRVLLLIDGVRIHQNISDGGFLANEFLLDVDLIEPVEFVPGPGSAMYGNNTCQGMTHVISRRGHDFSGAELSAAYGGISGSS